MERRYLCDYYEKPEGFVLGIAAKAIDDQQSWGQKYSNSDYI